MPHIVLIGPIGVGKSTVAPLVASLTGRSMVSMDEVRFDYYRRVGYDDAVAARFGSSGDIAGLIGYWKPFEADAVERLVVDERHAVLDFGAGHADYPAGPLLDRVAAALAEHFVVLLLPNESIEESAALLWSRLPFDDLAGVVDAVHELNRGYIGSPSFRQLADATVYVAGRTPADIAAEVVERWAGGPLVTESAIDVLLAEARSGLDRVEPEDLAATLAAGALVVDTRPADQRERDGVLPGALVIDRNVLEWRLDPTSPYRIPESDVRRRVVVVCNEGFSSSLAAATPRRLGLDATDLVGGFQAWRLLGQA